jgi:medium-chain acyl-[acyl-carrier-protein] hydrolase
MLFLSACDAPHLLPVRPPVRHLPEAEFLREVQSMGGTPPEVLAHKELVSLLLPALRSDFAVYETYEYREERPLDIPITALGGEADEVVGKESVLAWEKHTGEHFSSRFFPGGHFYLQERPEVLLGMIFNVMNGMS